MGEIDSPTEAALARLKSESTSSSPVDGVVDKVANLGGMVLEAVGFTGASNGIGFLCALKNLAVNKDEGNLIYFGDALLDDIRRLYRLYEELKGRLDQRIESPEFSAAVANATLHITRTNVDSRLKRLAHIIANGVKEGDLEPESLDDMMRAAVELKERDIKALAFIYSRQSEFLSDAEQWPTQWFDNVRRDWQRSGFEEGIAMQQTRSDFVRLKGSLSRLAAFGFIIAVPPADTTNSPGREPFALLADGKAFYERIKF
ncbi:MAG: hypothetical protein KGM96_07295 [Acidobacteriota bacterium]|nr:hypothetical protein [Acidobacteriota bacterium]